MKNLRCVFVFLAVSLLAGLALGAGCGSGVTATAVPDPISVNTLDGSEGVPVDSTFKYVFPRPMITSAVTKSTFFIVKNEVSSSLNKAVVDGGICDSTQALDVSVGCSSPAECTLTPAELLEYSSIYSICLTGNMQYATGEQFGSFMATFTAEAEGPLDLNNLNGAVDVPVDSSFRYRFLKEVDTSTVDTSTYFIVPTPAAESASISKAAIDPVICDSTNAVASEITCTRWSCTIAPSAYLEYITGYTACLTSAISYTSSFTFDGFMASFTTGEWILSSIKLVRLDDTELELTDRPIPRMVSVKLAMSVAVTDESERATFESAVSLVDGDGTAADGTYEWAADFLSVVFTPNHRLEYGTEYTIDVDTSVLPPLSLSRALSAGDMSFTTMTDKDINGDGFADVIVSALRYPDGPYKGRAYIYLGSASGISDCDLSDSTCVPHATITGMSDGDQLGDSISMAGDVNADGYADIIVGAPAFDGARGRAYVFLGSVSGIADCDLEAGCIPDATITGEYNSDLLGISVSTAGDVNADGYDDIIVGARWYLGGNNKGRAYVFLGGSQLSGNLGAADADATITGENDDDELGVSVSTAGDVNGDGYDDVIVGAFYYPGGDDKGRAYIFLGGSQLSGDLGAADADATITGEKNGDHLGISVSTTGDVNGDGYGDVIVGARFYDSGGGITNNGQAYIFLGSGAGISDCDLTPPSTCVPDATITGGNTDDRLGGPVSDAGDINADGYDDIIVGAYGFDGDGTDKGRAYVFLGSETGIVDCDLTPPSTCVPDATFTGENTGDYLGISVSTAGDVNGDGYDDIIMGAPGSWPDYFNNHAYIFMGSAASISDCDLGGGCTADTTLTGESNGDMFGDSVN